MLTPSEHFYVSIYKLLAHTVDLIVRTAMTYLNVSFAPEVCAGCFYCQNSLTGRLSSLKTSETGSPRLEPSPFSLCPRHYSSKDFHKMQFSFSRNFLTAVGAHQLLCRSRASQGDHGDGSKAGVPLFPDNS